MKIGIDARGLEVPGGSRNYCINFLQNLTQRENVVLFGVNNYEDYKCVPTVLNQRNPILRITWENFILPFLIVKYKISIFHGLKSVVPIFANCKKVVTVHDMTPMKYPYFYPLWDRIYWRYIIPIYIKNSYLVIASSKSTKNDLIYYLNIDPKIITTVHLSYSELIYEAKDKKECYKDLKDSFVFNEFKKRGLNIENCKIILGVSTLQPSKNFETLIRAFNVVAKTELRAVLVICGKKGWKYKKIFEEYESSPFRDRIIFFHDLEDSNIVSFYNISKVFVYPSFYEGFGLPILEAQACGSPVVSSNISSIPEVAGEGAILINPGDHNEVASAITLILNNIFIKKSLINKGKKNIKRFSWVKCVGDTLEVYKEAYDK